MELTPLRYFLRAADRENFTRAAEDLKVSQPALSRAVAGLERELGRPLFERDGRTVKLTDAGRTFRTQAAKIVGLADDARAELVDDGRTGAVRVAIIPTLAPYLLPGLLRSFVEIRPEAEVRVAETVTAECVRKVRAGESDLALLTTPVPDPALHVERLYEEELLAALPAGHRLAETPTLTVGDLQSEPFVLLGEAHCLSEEALSFCRRSGVQPILLERTSQLATVKALVAAGHGVSLIPAAAAAEDPGIAYRRLTGDRPTRTVVAAWDQERYVSKLTKAFLDVLRGRRAG
ncbi:LysR family transcriptional regulator [Alienimonas californiensis]|uniref:HTH-type transcriptional regulator GltC n=1 Tax=Alienimonas californiensis TaxID=2527989 RepID=A0A517P541_9PLAN|nr:hydrogen peroxide-inducible genes activator [Alienimonas californiensis]QDT14481.1 HTH-type transcriptional regulator GltC [Alienimonas californiensis]